MGKERENQAFSLNVCRVWSVRGSEHLHELGEQEARGRGQEQVQKEAEATVLK